MNKVISFVKMDFYTIKPYVKSVAMMLIMGIVMSYFMHSSEILTFYMSYISVILIGYPFAVSEKNHLDILYSSVSVGRKNVVLGRYLFAIIVFVLATIFSISVSLIFNSMVLHTNVIFKELLLSVSLTWIIVCFMGAFQYPIFFKNGYAKSKLIIVVPFLLIYVLIFIISKLDENNISLKNIIEYVETNTWTTSFILIAVGIVLLCISYFISLKIYLKKDF